MKEASSGTTHRRLHPGFLGGILLVALAFVLWVPEAEGFRRYQDGCNTAGACHGAFTDATTQKGSLFPGNDKHTMHRASQEMNTDCDMCHTSGDNRNPFIGSSDVDGDGNANGPGCNGCHNGVGLRLHHNANGQTFCFDCHSNVPAPPENTNPEYYGTPGTRATDSCNGTMAARTGENWTLNDFVGLDNDGDDFYDAADPDCTVQPLGAGAAAQLELTLEANGDLSFTWGDSCALSDNDYGVYEGVMEPIPAGGAGPRDFSSHQFVQCSTSGGTTATITPSGDMMYYLVVPSNGSEEGSYGTDRAGAERGPGISACATQILAACSS